MATWKNTKGKTANGGSQANVQHNSLMALESRLLFSAGPLLGEFPGQASVDDGAVVVEQSFANSQSDQEPQVSVLDVGALGILGANYDKTNATYADGDLNEDGIVNITDLGILGANWKATHVQGVIWGQTIDSRGNASENLVEGNEQASLGIWTDGTMSSMSEFPAEFSSFGQKGDPRLVVGAVSTTSTEGGAIDHNSPRQSWHSLCDFTGVRINDDGTGQQINDEGDDVVNILTTKIPNGTGQQINCVEVIFTGDDGTGQQINDGGAVDHNSSRQSWLSLCDFTGQQINDDDAQLANVDMQNMLQKMQQTLQMMSNISKSCHDTAMAIIRKMN